MWHQWGHVLQGGDGEGGHGTSPGADQDEEGQRGGENGLMWRTTSKPYYCSGEAATSTQKDLPAAVGSLCGHRGDFTSSFPQRDSLSLRWQILVWWSPGIEGTGSPSDCALSGQTGWEEEVKMPPEPKTSGDRALWELQQRRSGRPAGSIWSDPSKCCSLRRLLATSQLLPKSRPRPGYLLHILPQETLGNQEVFNSEV